MGNDNIVWQKGLVTSEDRKRLLKQEPATLWLTGLSASGKSAISYAVEEHLTKLGLKCYVLDGDNLRHGLNSDLSFSSEGRAENLRRAAEVSRLMNDAGLIVIVGLISPFCIDRARARTIIGPEFFREVYISTSLEVCESRDPKGLYRRARDGVIDSFTGVSAPYEKPESPDLILDAGVLSVDECVRKICELLGF